jgi:hypothetical protein
MEARSLATLPERLRELSRDHIRPVRIWTTRNRNTPPDALDALARDSDPLVRWNAVLHPTMPESGLRYLADAEAAEHSWFIVRERVIAHPNCGRELQHELRGLGVKREGWLVQQYRSRTRA